LVPAGASCQWFAALKFRQPANGAVTSQASAAPEALAQLNGDLAKKGRGLVSIAVELHDGFDAHALSATVEWFIQRISDDQLRTT
jgi:hypothetical protein